jgi:hypothetical protein
MGSTKLSHSYIYVLQRFWLEIYIPYLLFTSTLLWICLSFVDDTDLLQVISALQQYGFAISSLQQAIDTWEGGLKVTGGALVTEKTFWYLNDFEWKNGEWSYKSAKDCPGKVFANDILENRTELQRVEPSIAEETLGILLAPDGSTGSQAAKMRHMADTWATEMRKGNLSKSEAWIALISTFWRSLSYPIPALNLTKDQCEKIMAPALVYVLPALGICHMFPRDLVFTSERYFGLGIPHLYTMQEIYQLLDVLNHTATLSITGSLYQATLELLVIELGSTEDLHKLPFPDLHRLTTNSLIKSTWEFLYHNELTLRHNIHFPQPRERDIEIMTAFFADQHPIDILDHINKCQLYLRAFLLSDITDGSGKYILQEAWQGNPLNLHRVESWPDQGKPSPTMWQTWRSHLAKKFLSRGRRLRHSLGHWKHFDTTWPWYISLSDNRLYKI